MMTMLVLPTIVVSIFTWWCQQCIILCCIITIAYYMGWIHRIIWYIAEREATKILNGTQVTCSTLSFDIFRGKVLISNCIIHAPKQSSWLWEAPIFARIGKIYVEVNIMNCLLTLWCLWEELPLDIYTICVSDIQVFVERKHNIYNFLLLDPHVVIPIPTTTPNTTTTSTTTNVSSSIPSYSPSGKREDENDIFIQKGNKNRIVETDIANNNDYVQQQDEDVDDNEKAQYIVENIVDSVRQASAISSNDTGKNPVHTLLDQYRHLLTDQLKAFTTSSENSHNNDTTTLNNSSTSNNTNKPSASTMMLESVNLIKNVTANIAEKTVQAQQVIIPERRTLPNEKIVYGRIGRLLIQDMRIFVYDNQYHNSNNNNTNKTIDDPTNNNKINNDDTIDLLSAWHPPIVIPKLAIRANEFCPPLTAKERKSQQQQQGDQRSTTNNNNNYDSTDMPYDPTLMPALYQTMDAYVDIIWKRVLAEVAKSNTGQFFQTAMGEVVNLFSVVATTNNNNDTSISTSSSSLQQQQQQDDSMITST